MDRHTVLIVSDGPVFSAEITSRWQTERLVPAFTLMQSDLCRALDPNAFQLAIVSGVRPSALSDVLKALEATGNPVLLVSEEGEQRGSTGAVKTICKAEGWLELLIALADEILLRRQAEALSRRLQLANAVLEKQAALGRYMLDMRHGLNNALTSVLGNSELLLLEPASVPEGARPQIETIHNMAIRMHETMQRFSSLEKELKATDPKTGRAHPEDAAAAAGAS
jgi:signal transduction histidine kinase